MLCFLEQHCKDSIRSYQRTHILNPDHELRMAAAFNITCVPEQCLPLTDDNFFARQPPVGQGFLIHEVSR